MSNRKLIILGVAAVIMIILAVVQNSSPHRGVRQSSAQAYLIQGLDISDITEIAITATAGESVTLRRQKGKFVVADRDNYPASVKNVNALITSCVDIKTTEMYTSDAKNHEDLGVAEGKAEKSVKFLKSDSSLITGIVIGKRKKEGQGSFLRLAGDDRVYLAMEVPWIRARPISYVDTELISVKADDVESVTVGSGKDSYTIRRQGGKAVLENVPEGKQQKESDCKTVLEALSNLRFSDVKKDSSGIDFNKEYVCKLKDSTVYTLDIGQKDSANYLKCRAEFTKDITFNREKKKSEEELKQKETELMARDKVKDFTEKHKGWIYQLKDSDADVLSKSFSEIVEDINEPAAVNADANQPAVPGK